MKSQIYLDLIEKAKAARKLAYAPYSGYKVGSALLLSDGAVFVGANIENSAYSETVCAERVAFFNAISSGKRDGFRAIAILGGKDEYVDSFAAPCGACRQVMSEFCKEDFEIILFNGKDVRVFKLSELLPLNFNSENLK